MTEVKGLRPVGLHLGAEGKEQPARSALPGLGALLRTRDRGWRGGRAVSAPRVPWGPPDRPGFRTCARTLADLPGAPGAAWPE